MDSTQPIESNSIPPTRDKSVHGKRYTIAQKLAIKALQTAGVSAESVAPILESHPRTIRRIWDDEELNDLSPNVVSRVKTGMQGLFYKRGLQGLLAMTPEKYAESSLLQIATTVGIMTEKGRLMDGLSTENVSFKGVSQSIDEDRAKIMLKLKELE